MINTDWDAKHVSDETKRTIVAESKAGASSRELGMKYRLYETTVCRIQRDALVRVNGRWVYPD